MRDALRAIPIFKELANEDLDLIAKQLKHVSYAKDETIFKQGDLGDGMYIVESGQVVVWDDKADEALAYLGQGSFVGEIALLLPEPRSASLKVAIDADLYVLEKNDFDQLLNERPAIAINMTRELSRRLLNTTQQRFQTKARRISALFGKGLAPLIQFIKQHISSSVAVIPIDGAEVPTAIEQDPDIMVLDQFDVSIENLASVLGLQVDVYGHTILLIPSKNSSLTQQAVKLSDTVISIGVPQPWVKDHVESQKLWETTDDADQMARIARRLTGRTVGLALSQGSAKGLAHIGVILALRQANIPIDIVAGSSIGSLFGAFLAAGWQDEQFYQFAEDTQEIVSKKWNWDINLPPKAGIIKGARVRNLIEEWLEGKNFTDLKTPFHCVAADIVSGTEVVFGTDQPHKAHLADAVRASISLPILFNPWEINGQYLMDGGLVNPIPAKLLRDKGADIVIVSNVVEPLDSTRNAGADKMPGFLKIIGNIVTLAADELAQSQVDLADVLIHTKVDVEHALDVRHASQFIEAGKHAAEQHLEAIRACLQMTPSALESD
ncbi:MAG: patatin-like phospholipase family protein [Chloroflexota bacterium]